MDELESARAPRQSEEDGSVFALQAHNVDQRDRKLAVEKEKENEEPGNDHMVPNRHPLLKYTYGIDQWSPLNKSGKKAYDREFLIQLQGNPNSKIKPLNVPNLDVILRNNSRSNPRSMDSTRFIGRHDSALLFPSFVKSSKSVRGPLAVKRGPLPPKPKTKKLAVSDESLSMQRRVITSVISLHESENTKRWYQLQSGNVSEDFTAEALYMTVREVLNKLTPQTFHTLVNQVKALQIDSNEKLQGIVDLVYGKAVSDPEFGKVYALMCKELGTMHVSVPENEAGKDDSDVNFIKLIITRCVTEFEEASDRNVNAIESRKIEAIADPGNEIRQSIADKEQNDRIKSFRNIRFIGELFKQGLLTSFIMHRCIRYLLSQIDDENMECLSKLLSAVGKVLESRDQNLEPYFTQMMEIVSRQKLDSNVSSKVCFMLQHVIELRMNKWLPRGDSRNSKTINQNMLQSPRNVSADASRTLLPDKFSILNTMNQDGCSTLILSGKSVEDTAVTQLVKNQHEHSTDMLQLSNNIAPKNIATDNVEIVKLNNEAHKQDKHSDPPVSGSIPSDLRDQHSPDNKLSTVTKRLPILSQQRLIKRSTDILGKYLDDPSIDAAAVEVCKTFDDCTVGIFVREVLLKVINKSDSARQQVTQLLMHLISTNSLPPCLYLSSLGDVLNASGDVAIDVSKIWAHLAELIWYPLTKGTYPFSQLKSMMTHLKKKGFAGTLIGEIMSILVREKGEEWVKDEWDKSGLEWSDFLQETESLDDFIKKYKLEFLIRDSNSSFGSFNGQPLSMEQIHEQLRSLMSTQKKTSFDNICTWIFANVGKRVSEPEFIKALMTAILEVSVEPYDDTWRFRVDKFHNLQALILWYIDATINLLELQCLIGIQQYIHKLEDPKHSLLQILEKQIFESILSVDVYHIWENSKDLIHPTAKSVAMLAVRSFFTDLNKNNMRPDSEKTLPS